MKIILTIRAKKLELLLLANELLKKVKNIS
jgi:hypothetical protein